MQIIKVRPSAKYYIHQEHLLASLNACLSSFLNKFYNIYLLFAYVISFEPIISKSTWVAQSYQIHKYKISSRVAKEIRANNLDVVPEIYIRANKMTRVPSEDLKQRPLTLTHSNQPSQQSLVRGDRDFRANLMPIYDDLYQIKL